MTRSICGVRRQAIVAAIVLVGIACSQCLQAQEERDFYWTPVVANQEQPNVCYFRKKMTLVAPDLCEVLIAASGSYNLYLNGRLVASGAGSNSYQTFDTARFVFPGVNVIAVEVNSTPDKTPGLALRFRVKEKYEARWRAMSLDESWLTHQSPLEDWQKQRFRDLDWLPAAPAAILAATRVAEDRLPGEGKMLATAAATNSPGQPTPAMSRDSAATSVAPQPVSVVEQRLATSPTASAATTGIAAVETAAPTTAVASHRDGPASNLLVTTDGPQEPNRPQPGPDVAAKPAEPRFELGDEFEIDPVLGSDECGSIIAMAFDEWGYLIFSQEGGHLKIADLSIPYGEQRVATLCDEVENCQGLLPLNGRLYVTGTGPQGLGLYVLERISPESTRMKVAQLLVKFKGEANEHGPHGLTLGPDGMIYCIVGNGTGIETPEKVAGPYRYPLEIDLAPRIEDPSGHSNGVRAPAGIVLRLGLDGSNPQIMAGGIRNAYDLAFNAHGDLFIHDSDMESDLGLPWYRPTAIYHVTDGADIGWRSGWAKYPYYYLDTVQPVATTGRGSPSGAVCYTHINFPARYHGALFLADWSEGRVLAVRQTVRDATYVTEVEEFLKGRPLNVTDLDVGEDGALYLATGGRGTSGGVYRVAWKGHVPDSVMQFKTDIARLVRQPQPTAAWARQNLAEIFYRDPAQNAAKLTGVALDSGNTPNVRCQAIENLYLYGHLSEKTLITLAKDPLPQIRAKIAYFCGTNPKWAPICTPLLADDFKYVRRRAAESLLRTNTPVSLNDIVRLLADDDDTLASLGTRLLEQAPASQWRQTIVNHPEPRVFCYGALSLLRVEPTTNNSLAIINRSTKLLDGFLSDRDFVHLLRISQIALARANLDPKQVETFGRLIAAEFPTSNSLLNRELIRLLTYLRVSEIQDVIVDYLRNHSDDQETKILVAMVCATNSELWNDATRVALIDSLHHGLGDNQAGTFRLYLSRSIRALTEAVSKPVITEIIENGDKWPYALVPAFYRLSTQDMAELTPQLVALDQRLQPNGKKDVIAQARMGIIALLAEGKTDAGHEYLRKQWVVEPDRRRDLAIGLAQRATPENWAYLIASLPIVNDLTAGDILNCIEQVSLRPVDAQHFRELIELGYRLRNHHAMKVSQILAMWTETEPKLDGQTWEQHLAHWTRWFHETWPNEQPIQIPQAKAVSVSFAHGEEILNMLEQRTLAGNAERGLHVFTKADCAKCHRFGSTGSSSGPDLTSVAKRFSKRDTLDAIIEPSKIVSDQYRSTMVVTENGLTFVGLKVENNDGSITLIVSSGDRVRLNKSEIVEQKFVEQSSMPEGLLNELSRQEIADLFAFLYNERDAVVADASSHASVK